VITLADRQAGVLLGVALVVLAAVALLIISTNGAAPVCAPSEVPPAAPTSVVPVPPDVERVDPRAAAPGLWRVTQ
jgi:hypothetical protein